MLIEPQALRADRQSRIGLWAHFTRKPVAVTICSSLRNQPCSRIGLVPGFCSQC